MLDILTYLLGWASGLFVGVAMGGYFHDFIRFRRANINYINLWNMLRNAGLFKLSVVALDYFFGTRVAEVYARVRNIDPENSMPRQERCDVPSGQNPNSRNQTDGEQPFVDVANLFRDSVMRTFFPAGLPTRPPTPTPTTPTEKGAVTPTSRKNTVSSCDIPTDDQQC
jgi:hypothetical protein